MDCFAIVYLTDEWLKCKNYQHFQTVSLKSYHCKWAKLAAMHLTCWIDFQKLNHSGLGINLFSLDDVCVILKSLRNSSENRRTV